MAFYLTRGKDFIRIEWGFADVGDHLDVFAYGEDENQIDTLNICMTTPLL